MKDIQVDIPLDDCLNLLCFLQASAKQMREITEGMKSIECEINISTVERFYENLTSAVTSQVDWGEIAETIKELNP